MLTENALSLNAERPRWHPAPVIVFSVLLHAAGVIACLIHPALWPWMLGLLVSNHLALTGAALMPRGRLLGPNLTRLPESSVQRNEVALTFDDGPDPNITPRVLDLLDRHQAKASFFCIGERAAAYPDLVKEITRRGHSVENHSYHHPHAFALYGIPRLRREIAAAQKVIADITGSAPQFFRAPVGFRSPMLDFVLTQSGLRYVSWTRRGLDGVHNTPAAVLRRLTHGLAAGDILLLHDGVCLRDCEPAVLSVLPLLLEQLTSRGLRSTSLAVAFSTGIEPPP